MTVEVVVSLAAPATTKGKDTLITWQQVRERTNVLVPLHLEEEVGVAVTVVDATSLPIRANGRGVRVTVASRVIVVDVVLKKTTTSEAISPII